VVEIPETASEAATSETKVTGVLSDVSAIGEEKATVFTSALLDVRVPVTCPFASVRLLTWKMVFVVPEDMNVAV
jgi:hypothetical protein